MKKGGEYMNKKITKFGNSIGITLNRDLLAMLGIYLGDEVEMKLEKDKIVIKKIDKE